MPPQTISESFNGPLPKSPSIKLDPPRNKEGYRYLPKITTGSTREHDPPEAYIKMKPMGLAQLANDAIEHARRKNPRALSAVMPTLERTHLLKNEADGSERVDARTSRFDILWTLCDEHGAEENIAVLEMKSTHVIHEKDFLPAEATTQAEFNSKVAHAYTIERGDNEPSTCLEENATKLARQADKYAARCRHVVLFDWTAMFLFEFRRVHNPLYASDKAARGFFFTESSPRPDYLNICRLLLAFVAEPLKEALRAI
ncbi:uncharacterized protein N7483_010230 [Penicillium malachiteum]|uniref:uncharacterized protein n=1 Tax=Penicillium malachiteum TaxID=1324776 RepID=UPI0025496843|nr:uncharacterized protein N7483_010230 [Penicillium malachiteum]KAJ5713049.1 hypothetical protein N7483_010230 [Penicillium malachiteum]